MLQQRLDFRRAVLNGNDVEARIAIASTATFAGMGFRNAGVHIPHAAAYPIAGMVRDYRPATAGFGEDDIPGLVEGTLKQQRLLACCPRPVEAGELPSMFRESMNP